MADACLDSLSLHKEFLNRGPEQIMEDILVCLKWLGGDDIRSYALTILHGALRLSFDILKEDANQFAIQLKGRLGAYDNKILGTFLDGFENLRTGTQLVLETPSLDSPESPVLCTIGFGDVRAIAVDRHGRYLAGAGRKSIRIWDIEKSVNMGTPSVLGSHTKSIVVSDASPIQAIAISSTGPGFAAGLESGIIIVRQGPEGIPRTLESGVTAPVASIKYCVDDTRILAGFKDGTIGIFEIESGDLLHIEKPMPAKILGTGIRESIFDMAVSLDSNSAVTAHGDGIVRSWDLVNCKKSEWEWKAFEDAATGIAITPDQHWLVVHSGYGYRTKTYDFRNGEIKEYNHIIGYKLAVTGEGELVVSAPEQGDSTVWDIETGQPVRTIDFRSKYIHSIISTSGERPCIIAADNSTITIMDVQRRGGLEARHLGIGRYPPCWKALSRNGSIGASICFAGANLDLWDMTAKEPVLLEDQTAEFLYPVEEPVVATAPLGYKVAGLIDKDSLMSGYQIRILDVNKENKTVSIPCNINDVYRLPGIALSPDGRLLMISYHDRQNDGVVSAEVWDTIKLCRLSENTIPTSYDLAAITRNGYHAVFASGGDITLFDLSNNRLVPYPICLGLKVQYLSTTWNSRNGIAVFKSGQLIVWDIISSRILFKIKLSFLPETVAALPDNKHIVVVGGKWLEVWDYIRGECIGGFTSDNHLSAFSASDDNSLIYTVDQDDRIHTLRINSGDVNANMQ